VKTNNEYMGIFNRFVKKRELDDTEDFEQDLRSIYEFLYSLDREAKDLKEKLDRVRKIRNDERSEVDNKKQAKLLESEINLWDQFLERYVIFDRDADITSARAKKVSEVLREEAKKLDLHKSVIDKVTKKDEWVFNW
jgi:hypothetical protein